MTLTSLSKAYIKDMLCARRSAITQALSKRRYMAHEKFSVQGREKRTAEQWKEERQRVVDCINQMSEGTYG